MSQESAWIVGANYKPLHAPRNEQRLGMVKLAANEQGTYGPSIKKDWLVELAKTHLLVAGREMKPVRCFQLHGETFFRIDDQHVPWDDLGDDLPD